MNENDYLQLLQQHDDPIHWEVPGGWESYDYKKAHKNFLDLVKRIEKAVGAQCRYKSEGQIQDASFIGLIGLPTQCHNDCQVNLRISHFGNFAGWSDDTKLKPEYLELVNQVLQEQGYIYIPTYILEKPYTSKNFEVTWINTWWLRYFNYV